MEITQGRSKVSLSLTTASYRSEKEIRQERVARGIIPPDEPEIEILVEASKEPTPTLSRRKLRQLAEGEARLKELERMLAQIIMAQQIADEFAHQDMLKQLAQQQVNRKNQNALLVMLGLL